MHAESSECPILGNNHRRCVPYHLPWEPSESGFRTPESSPHAPPPAPPPFFAGMPRPPSRPLRGCEYGEDLRQPIRRILEDNTPQQLKLKHETKGAGKALFFELQQRVPEILRRYPKIQESTVHKTLGQHMRDLRTDKASSPTLTKAFLSVHWPDLRGGQKAAKKNTPPKKRKAKLQTPTTAMPPPPVQTVDQVPT